MKLAFFLSSVISLIVVFLVQGAVLAAEPRSDFSTTLAVVPVKNGNVDQGVYRQFDRLVPELKKIAKNKIIKLECRYSGRSDRAQDVESAYKMAARIEHYLRVRHKLDLDLWVSIDITPKADKLIPVMTVAVFSDEIQKLDAVLVDPPRNIQ